MRNKLPSMTRILTAFSIILILALPFMSVHPVSGAKIFEDGFESGTILTSDSPAGAWDGDSPVPGSTVQVVSSPVHSGSHALLLGTDGSQTEDVKVWKNFTRLSTAYGRCYVRFGALNIASGYSLIVWFIGNQTYDLLTSQARVYNNNGTLIWQLFQEDDSANHYMINCSSGPVINQWYCVELERIQDVSNGGAAMWVDGAEVASITGLNTASTGYTCQCACDGESTGYFVDSNYFDDIVISDSYINTTDLGVSISPSFGTLDVGQSQVFTSTVSNGISPYTYQWCINGTAISDATNSTWAFTPTSSGSYTVYLNVTDGMSKKAKSNIASVSVRVVPIVPDFSISASPSSLTIVRDASGTSTINITSIDSFNSAVSLVISGAPSGVTLTLGLTSVTPVSGGFVTSTLVVVVNATTAPNSYTLTVTGTSGSLTHNATISLIVTQSRVIRACVEFEPGIVNLKSQGKWIMAIIELPKNVKAKDVDFSSIKINATISATGKTIIIGKCWLSVRFNRSEVIQYIMENINQQTKRFSRAVLTVTGLLHDGSMLQGIGRITFVSPPSARVIATHLGHHASDYTPYSPNWYTFNNCDLNGDRVVNVLDLIITATHLGQH